MISANDIYYLPRVKNLVSERLKCQLKLIELIKEFNTYVHFENCDVMLLNILNDRIKTIEALINDLDNQIERLRLETLN